MRIGIVETTYITKYGLTGGCELMKQHGYDCVDYQSLARFDGELYKLSERELYKKLSDERRLIEGCGITVNQSHSLWPHPIEKYDKSGLDSFYEAMALGLRASAELGVENYVAHPIMPFGNNSDEKANEMLEINFDFFHKISELGKSVGVNVCIENMPFPRLPLGHVSQVLDFVKEINNPFFKICIDTGHCLVCDEEPADSVRLVGKELLACLHIHDNDGKQDLHLLPEMGICKWKLFAEALKDINFEGVFSLETGFINRRGFYKIETHEEEINYFNSVKRLIM